MPAPVLGSIEGGGTKWVCAVGTGHEDIRAETTIPTTAPRGTLAEVVRFFGQYEIEALGVATFGPVELRPDNAEYGYITRTPKPGWSGTDVVGRLRSALGVPVGFQTDVNGAALAELEWGAGVGLDSLVYITVGTGIGGGAVTRGELAGGVTHPEIGHLTVPRHYDDSFGGRCPFHTDCLEGMASGPAIQERWGGTPSQLDEETSRKALAIEAHYLAQGIRNLVYAYAPDRIVMGGGVSHMDGLIDAVGAELRRLLGGYPALPEFEAPDYVTRPGLGDRSGIAGGFLLAASA